MIQLEEKIKKRLLLKTFKKIRFLILPSSCISWIKKSANSAEREQAEERERKRQNGLNSNRECMWFCHAE